MTTGKSLVVLDETFSDKKLPGRFNQARFDKDMRWQAEREYAKQLAVKNPQILDCTPESIQVAMLEVAWSGMSLAPSLQHAYLIPYKDTERQVTEVQFSPGYRGLAYMVQRGGAVTGWTTGRVLERDKFRSFTTNNRRYVEHEENYNVKDRGKLVAVYAIAHLASGEDRVEVTPAHIVEAAYQASMRKNPKGGFAWKGPFRDQMEIKVAIRRVCKLVPADASGWLQRGLEVVDKHDAIDFGKADEAGDGVTISAEQVQELAEYLTQNEQSAEKWLAHLAEAYNLRRIEDLPADKFEEAKGRIATRLEAVRAKRGGK